MIVVVVLSNVGGVRLPKGLHNICPVNEGHQSQLRRTLVWARYNQIQAAIHSSSPDGKVARVGAIIGPEVYRWALDCSELPRDTVSAILRAYGILERSLAGKNRSGSPAKRRGLASRP